MDKETLEEVRRVKAYYPYRRVFIATTKEGKKEVVAVKTMYAINRRLLDGEKIEEVKFS